MIAVEANVVLTKAALLDPRMKRVDPVEQADMATAWAEVLADVPLEQALTAVTEHYRMSRDAIMPADILERVGVVDEPASPYRNITAELAAKALEAGDTPA